MYRVYDKRKKRWRSNNVYLAPNENLYRVESSLFGKKDKLILLDEDRFIVHRDTGLTDKNSVIIFEGDIVKAEVEDNAFIIAEVVYLHNIASYAIMSFKMETWYNLGTQVSERIEVIGNVFDTPNLLEFKEEAESNE